MLQMSYHTVVKHKLNDNFVLRSLMNLPCDAVTVLMVITSVLIYAGLLWVFADQITIV